MGSLGGWDEPNKTEPVPPDPAKAASAAEPTAAAKSEPPAKPAETAAKPVEPASATPPAEPPKPAAPAKNGETEPDVNAWPKNKAEWKKWIDRRGVEQEDFRKQISERDTKLKEMEDQLTKAQAATVTVAEDPKAKQVLEEKDKLIKELSDRLTVLDVTHDPRFEAYFKGKVDSRNALARNILGEEKARTWDELQKLPNGNYKDSQIEELVADLTPLQQSRIGAVINDLASIEAERQDEIGKAAKHKETLTSQQQEAQKQRQAKGEELFKTTLATLQSEKDGNPLYRTRQGDDQWNAGLAKRVEQAKALFFGQGIKNPADIVRAALDAASMPTLIKHWQADLAEGEAKLKAKDGEIAKLQEQVKTLSAAQPNGGTTGQPAGTEAGKGPRYKPGMHPFQVANAFADAMNEGL